MKNIKTLGCILRETWTRVQMRIANYYNIVLTWCGRFRWSSRIHQRTCWSRSASTDTTPSRIQWTFPVAVSHAYARQRVFSREYRFFRVFSGRRARALIGCAWILSFVFAVPSIFINEETIIQGRYTFFCTHLNVQFRSITITLR